MRGGPDTTVPISRLAASALSWWIRRKMSSTLPTTTRSDLSAIKYWKTLMETSRRLVPRNAVRKIRWFAAATYRKWERTKDPSLCSSKNLAKRRPFLIHRWNRSLLRKINNLIGLLSITREIRYLNRSVSIFITLEVMNYIKNALLFDIVYTDHKWKKSNWYGNSRKIKDLALNLNSLTTTQTDKNNNKLHSQDTNQWDNESG